MVKNILADPSVDSGGLPVAIVYKILIGEITQRDANVTAITEYAGILLIDGEKHDIWQSTHNATGNPVVGSGGGAWTRHPSQKTIELLDDNGVLPQGTVAYESWPFRNGQIGKIFLKRPISGTTGGAGSRVIFDYFISEIS